MSLPPHSKTVRKQGDDPWVEWRGTGNCTWYLPGAGLVRFSTIGAATLRGIRTRDMVDTILAMLKAEPERWFHEKFLAWWREAVGSG